jgi:hypothetical protein
MGSSKGGAMNKKQIILEKYKETTLGKAEFVRQMMKELDTTERYVYKALASEEVKGETEYTPKHELTDKGYKVNYANTYVEATHEEIRKSFMMYCVGSLTMNQVSLKMGWTRAEFNAIKTAFHITKDAPPFTPYEIDRLTADEMAELIRIEKKRYSLAKFEQNKHKDIEKEIKRYNQTDFFVTRLAELFNAKEPVQFEYKEINTNEYEPKVYSIRNTDIHSGSEISNIYGEYNLEIMKKWFEYELNWIRSNIPKGSKLILTDGGDTTHGKIHGSVEKHGTYVILATIEVMKCYETLIEELLKDYIVEFAKVNGSHEALEKNPKDRTEEENLGNLILFVLERLFSNYSNFSIRKKLKGLPHVIINIVDNFDVMLDHGDKQTFKQYSTSANMLNQLGYNIKEVWLGHLHHYQAEYLNGILVERTEAFTITDQYAAPKGLNSPNGFRVTRYSETGRIDSELIEFKE